MYELFVILVNDHGLNFISEQFKIVQHIFSFVSPILKTVKLKALSVHSKKLNKKGQLKPKSMVFFCSELLCIQQPEILLMNFVQAQVTNSISCTENKYISSSSKGSLSYRMKDKNFTSFV